jgi:PPM family protein phosphatase
VPELMDKAIEQGGLEPDNCTTIAMSWAGTESMDMIPPTEAPVSTLVIPEGAVASTVQMPRPGEAVGDEPLTDEQINEAVAEIQRAIQRSTRLIHGK